MPHIDVRPDLEAAPLETITAANDAGRLLHGTITAIGILPGGMESGRASVALTIETRDGYVVVGETSLDLLAGATRALLASPIARREGHDRARNGPAKGE